MNRNPNIIAISPIIMIAIERVLCSCLIFQPRNADEIPKNNKLKPTITEINPDENIGNNMNIRPNIIDKIPALLLIIVSPPFFKLILYMD